MSEFYPADALLAIIKKPLTVKISTRLRWRISVTDPDGLAFYVGAGIVDLLNKIEEIGPEAITRIYIHD